jgi:hypothetical protein
LGYCGGISYKTYDATCKFTLDNEVTKVVYNGKDITSTVTGALNDWTVAKSVTFREQPRAALWITGQNIETRLQSSNYPLYFIAPGTDGNSAWIRSTAELPDQFVEKTTWLIRPALNGASTAISICSKLNPSLCLRHQNYIIKPHPNDGTDLYRQDASFTQVAGLIGTTGTFTFRSVNYPSHYIRHKNYQLFIDPNDGSDLFKRDASFFMKKEAASSCASGGLSIVCSSVNPLSAYNGLNSDTNKWRGRGFSTDPVADSVVYTNNMDISSWGGSTNCASTGTYKLNGVDSQPPKLWTSTGDRYVTFRFRP